MAENVLIETTLGKIRGKVAANCIGEKYYSFQGIPYAKAPIGKMRFKPPVPIDAWHEVLDGTKQGEVCPSIDLLFKFATGKEDNCLNLNIYIKELPESSVPLKPVMVWIHGGGFTVGSNATNMYGPEYLMTENVIQVMINYRLGIFGFLCLEDESLEVPGNAGMKDQVMALRWVKDNISSFGGDPDNITVYGHSAGAASVQCLLFSPMTEGLFHKVIIQSGSILCPWATMKRGTETLAKCLNIEVNDEHSILKTLQNMTVKQLLSIQRKVPDRIVAAFQRPFAPVIEKPSKEAFLSEHPLTLLKTGKYIKVPMIIGTTSKEAAFYDTFKLFESSSWPFDCTMEIPWDIKQSLNAEEEKEIVKKIFEFYKLKENPSEESTYDLKSDNLFVHGNHRFLRHHLESTNKPVYSYTFSFEGNCNYAKQISCSLFPKTFFLCLYLAELTGRNLFGSILTKLAYATGVREVSGSSHGDEITYLFGCSFSRQMEPDSREEKTMKRLVKFWTNFARYDHPTPENCEGGSEIVWYPAEKNNHRFLNMGDELTMGVNPFNERNQFWDQIYEEYTKQRVLTEDVRIIPKST